VGTTPVTTQATSPVGALAIESTLMSKNGLTHQSLGTKRSALSASNPLNELELEVFNAANNAETSDLEEEERRENEEPSQQLMKTERNNFGIGVCTRGNDCNRPRSPAQRTVPRMVTPPEIPYKVDLLTVANQKDRFDGSKHPRNRPSGAFSKNETTNGHLPNGYGGEFDGTAKVGNSSYGNRRFVPPLYTSNDSTAAGLLCNGKATNLHI
jgi:hypothetical protein